MQIRRLRPLLLLLPLLPLMLGTGCGDGGYETHRGQVRAALSEGTPVAIGILKLLNAKSTTFKFLDHEVALDRRAAQNLIDHRKEHGAFENLAEVDGVRWVGPSTMARLERFALAWGWVPSGGALLGTWDGVAFTVDEAEGTLAFVNEASAMMLDDEADLDRRAVRSILAARPVGSILDLSSLYYVGRSALFKLREFPKLVIGTVPDGSDCTRHDACVSGLCAGLTIDMGFCQPAWMEGTYASTESRAIPDLDSVTTAIVVGDQASVPMDLIVTLEIDHPRPQDLTVELFQPNGGYDLLWDHEASPAPVVNAWGIERDNSINGTWELRVTDTVLGETGFLVGWQMWVTSRYD